MYRTIQYDTTKTNICAIRGSRSIRRFHHKARWTSSRCSKSKNKRLQYIISTEIIVSTQRKFYDIFRIVFKIKDQNEKIISKLSASMCRLQFYQKRTKRGKYDILNYRERTYHVESVHSQTTPHAIKNIST